jgi:hypothetical protein
MYEIPFTTTGGTHGALHEQAKRRARLLFLSCSLCPNVNCLALVFAVTPAAIYDMLHLTVSLCFANR